MKVRQISISSIKIGKNRRPLRDVDDLAASINQVGLLNPITVTSDERLVAGLHRLEACKSIGWKKIPAVALPKGKLRNRLAELDENLIREELSTLERAEQLAERKRIYVALHPETRRGVAGGRARGSSRGGRKRTTDKMSFARSASVRLRVSTRTVERLVAIADALPDDVRRDLKGTPAASRQVELQRIADLPERDQRRVAKDLQRQRPGGTRAAIARLASRKRQPALPRGKHDVLVVDPPWRYESERVAYPTLTLDEIRAIPIPALAAKDSILWLWTTNAMMAEAHECVRCWGFQPKTILTWDKVRSTFGHWLLNRTEHCVLATRGDPQVVLTNESTIIRARVREHSRKPDEFYDLVEALCRGRRRKLDLFARETRKGWKAWGLEPGKFGRAA